MKLRERNHTSEVLAALCQAPHTLTSLCFALDQPPLHELRRLRRLAALGLVTATSVSKSRRPGEVADGKTRVVWHMKGTQAPSFEQLPQFLPPVPVPEHRERKQRNNLDPYTKEGRSPLEILAMLAGKTSYTVPTEGKSTRGPGITAHDVAHAIAASPEKLGAAVGVAIACQREYEWQKVHEMAYAPLLRELQRQRAFPGIVAGGLRFRVRLVLSDAFSDLLRPQQRKPYRIAAKERGIAESAYRHLHRHITAFLQARAAAAANDACKFLFSPFGIKRRHTLVLADGDGNVSVLDAETPSQLAARVAEQTDPETIDFLIAEMFKPGARQRTLGVLRMKGCDNVAVYIDSTEETENG